MLEDRDETTARDREIEALCAMLEFSKARADELGLDALAYSLESAIKIARMELADVEVGLANCWGTRM